MKAKILSWVLQGVLPVLALVGIVYAAVEWGRADARIKMAPEIAAIEKKRADVQADLDMLRGKVDVYVKVSGKVDDLRDTLQKQASDQQAVLLSRLSGLGVILSKVRTGNECLDAKSVAKEYFNLLPQKKVTP